MGGGGGNRCRNSYIQASSAAAVELPLTWCNRQDISLDAKVLAHPNICLLLWTPSTRSWIKEQKANDPNWVEPWNEKEARLAKAPRVRQNAAATSY